MDNIKEFEKELMGLSPRDDDFSYLVDDLLSKVPEESMQQIIPSIFRFFEAHPLDECGCLGALVHLIEDFYPSYVEQLKKSLESRPSYNTILMLNRILNSDLDERERIDYINLLKSISLDSKVETQLREEAAHYAESQTCGSS